MLSKITHFIDTVDPQRSFPTEMSMCLHEVFDLPDELTEDIIVALYRRPILFPVHGSIEERPP